MQNQIWSWVLALMGSAGIFVVGKKNKWGWPILMVNEMMWTVYSFVTKQYGFLVAVVLYSIVYIKSYMEWRRDG